MGTSLRWKGKNVSIAIRTALTVIYSCSIAYVRNSMKLSEPSSSEDERRLTSRSL